MKNEKGNKIICTCGKEHYIVVKYEPHNLLYKIHFHYSQDKDFFSNPPEFEKIDSNNIKSSTQSI